MEMVRVKGERGALEKEFKVRFTRELNSPKIFKKIPEVVFVFSNANLVSNLFAVYLSLFHFLGSKEVLKTARMINFLSISFIV